MSRGEHALHPMLGFGGRCFSRARPGVPGRAARLQDWFDSLSGQRKGPKVRQRLYVAKVGDIKVEWSRDLPSEPSSVTVIREPDGRHYASFVVRREVTPLSACDRETGSRSCTERSGTLVVITHIRSPFG
jgi:transposase